MAKRSYPLLKNLSLTADLSDAEIKDLTNIVFTQSFTAGSVVFHDGEPGKTLYIVRSGEFILSIGGKDQKSFRRGDVFGEIAIIDESVRTGTVRAHRNGELLCIDGDDLRSGKKLKPATALKLILELARLVTTYLRSVRHTSTRALVADGESDYVEFKASVRWNHHQRKKDREIEHAAMKSIAAFMNSRGGTLIFGIADSGKIIGLDEDRFGNDDKLLLHMANLIKEQIGAYFMNYVHMQVEDLNGKKILRVDVSPSDAPAYMEHNQVEKFYIRTGPATTNLPVSEVYDYITRRFPTLP
ncbi:MAG: hypothetical protein CL946_06475 [Ectothiorhodospiraceae bacterium]|nr:hypothetical protein [Ectothiorhodospiraceae bacterium]